MFASTTVAAGAPLLDAQHDEAGLLRDVQSYCGILLDDNNRKPICRLWFNTAQKYIGLFDSATDNTKEERIPIAHIDDVYKYADRFKATVARYETKPVAQKT